MFRLVKKWIVSTFGFSKSEANGSIVLIILVLIVAIIPRWIINTRFRNEVSTEEDKKVLEEWFSSVSIISENEEATYTLDKVESSKSKKPLVLRTFDPNEVSLEELLEMGFPQRIAQNLINYREAGGRYKEIKDLSKLYGMDDFYLQQLKNYLNFPEQIDRKQSSLSASESLVERSDSIHSPKIFINQATAADLRTIKGIGPILSERIIKYRDLLGGFNHNNQLYEIYGLQDTMIHHMKDIVQVDSKLTKININNSDIKILSSHPYINYSTARSISNYRKVHGPYTQIEDLKQIKIIDDSLFQKLSPYISVAPLSASE